MWNNCCWTKEINGSKIAIKDMFVVNHWVANNFLLKFAFTNKIGGALGLLGAGLSGTLAEVEVRYGVYV